MTQHETASTEIREPAAWHWVGSGLALMAIGFTLNDLQLWDSGVFIGVFALLLRMYQYVCRPGSGVRSRLLLGALLAVSLFLYAVFILTGLCCMELVEVLAGAVLTYLLWEQVRVLRRAMRRELSGDTP